MRNVTVRVSGVTATLREENEEVTVSTTEATMTAVITVNPNVITNAVTVGPVSIALLNPTVTYPEEPTPTADPPRYVLEMSVASLEEMLHAVRRAYDHEVDSLRYKNFVTETSMR